MKLLGNSLLLHGIKNSRQWRWERSEDDPSLPADQQETDCMIALIPDSESQDLSFVIRVGYWTGLKIAEYLEYGNSVVEG